MSLEVASGVVTSVDTRSVGAPVVGTAAAGDQTLFVEDNVDFSPGDEVLITPLDAEEGEVYTIAAVDDEVGITLTTPLVDDLAEGSWVAASPVQMQTVATVRLAESGEVTECIVLHTLTDAFRVGLRDETTAEVVLTIKAEDTRYVFDIISRAPVRDLTDAVVGSDPLEGTLQDLFAAASASAAAAADAAASATVALTAANGKSVNIYSTTTPGATPNNVGDNWFQKDAATQTIIGQWEGLGGTSWSQKTLANAVIANLDAGKLVAGSAFTNALWVKTNLTLGDAATNGVIQSHNFASALVGIYIDKFGMVAKGGTIAGAAIYGGTIGTAQSGKRVEMSSGTNSLDFYSASAHMGQVDYVNHSSFGDSVYIKGPGSSGVYVAGTLTNIQGSARVVGGLTVDSGVSVGSTLSMGDVIDMNGHSIIDVLNVSASGTGIFGDVQLTSPPTVTSAPNLRINLDGTLARTGAVLGLDDSGGPGFRMVRVPN